MSVYSKYVKKYFVVGFKEINAIKQIFILIQYENNSHIRKIMIYNIIRNN